MNGSKNNTQLSPLRKWILSNRYYIKSSDQKEDKTNPTHYLLDGGIWKVPLSDYSTFISLLAKDLQNGEKYYISENRTEVFRFVCDLDFYDSKEISIEELELIINKINSVVCEYYEPRISQLIICGTESKEVVVNENKLIKTGFHLVWPKIWINTVTAKKLRILFIKLLISSFGERESYNTWDDVVDLAVYEDNGLRMIGSRKMGICKCCKNKAALKKDCTDCESTGKKDEGRVYKPVKVMSGNKDFDTEFYFKSIKNDLYVMLLETCIINYYKHDQTPLKNSDFLDSLSIENTKKKKTKQIGGTSCTGGTGSNDTTEQIKKLETFIKKQFREHYSGIKIKKLVKADNYRYFIEPEDNFCMNVNRNHTSSGIYFNVTPHGISQRCMCKKHTTSGRLNGPCSTYSSKEIPLTKVLSKELFGKISSDKKIVNFNFAVNNNHKLLFNDKEKYLDVCKVILNQLQNQLKN